MSTRAPRRPRRSGASIGQLVYAWHSQETLQWLIAMTTTPAVADLSNVEAVVALVVEAAEGRAPDGRKEAGSASMCL